MCRFDLIYLILDKPNKENDRRLAQHLVSLYYGDHEAIPSKEVCDQDFLRDYIMYARSNIAPEITDGAEAALVEGYLSMRALGGRGSKTITATPRQLESLIRLSQAFAKMRLSKVIIMVFYHYCHNYYHYHYHHYHYHYHYYYHHHYHHHYCYHQEQQLELVHTTTTIVDWTVACPDRIEQTQ